MNKHFFLITLTYLLISCFILPFKSNAEWVLVGKKEDNQKLVDMINKGSDLNPAFSNLMQEIKDMQTTVTVWVFRNLDGVLVYSLMSGVGVIIDLDDLEKLPDGGWDGDVFYTSGSPFGATPSFAYTRYAALAEALSAGRHTANGIGYKASQNLAFTDLLDVRRAFGRADKSINKSIGKNGNSYTLALLEYSGRETGQYGVTYEGIETWYISPKGKILDISYDW